MADPTFVAAGVDSGGVGAITPALPAGIATDDILILAMRTVNGQASSVANAAGGTWTEFTGSPQDNATDGVRGTWFWSRYNGTQTAPTTNDSGTINLGVILAWRGCVATGDPFNATAGGVQTAATSMSNPGLTTTVDGCMIVVMSVCDRDAGSTANAASWVNASLVSITEVFDKIVAIGVGGGWAVANGIKTSAGAVSATTWTQAASGGTADLTVALLPLVSATTGTAAVTQDSQTSTAAAVETFAATSTVSQEAQAPTASGSVTNPVTGTVAATQADQTSTAAAVETFTATLAVTQANQTSTASALETITGTVAETQDDQTAIGTAVMGSAASGTVATTQDSQTSTASGSITLTFTGSGAVTQDTQTSTATAVETFVATLAETQDAQTGAATATLSITGTVGISQDAQTSTASGLAVVAVTGTLAEIQDDQFATATADGGTVTFWNTNPAAYTANPAAFVENPAAFVKVGAGDIPPNW